MADWTVGPLYWNSALFSIELSVLYLWGKFIFISKEKIFLPPGINGNHRKLMEIKRESTKI